MKSYYRVMLGKKSIYAEEYFKNQCIGAGFLEEIDLSGKISEDWRDFNKKFVPIYQEQNPAKNKIGAGLACGALWTIAKGIQIGDVVLSPNGSGSYYVGEVIDNYTYHPGENLPHRRSVHWFEQMIDRAAMSQELKNSNTLGTVRQINKFADEIERLIGGHVTTVITSNDPTIEDPAVFVLEKYLEEFLVDNWKYTEIGKNYDIYEEDGEKIGRQFPSDTGPIDILAISKDKKELLVVELKKGRASDAVVGQIQRYMGYVLEELAEKDQTVKGVIIALDNDLRIKRAMAVTRNIEFYRYQVNFKLIKHE